MKRDLNGDVLFFFVFFWGVRNVRILMTISLVERGFCV